MPNENDNKLVTLADLAEAYTVLYNRDVMTGVKGDAESSYRQGNVNITPANIGAVAKSGDTMTGNLIIQRNNNDIVITESINNRVSLSLYNELSGNHGIISNGYWNGSAFVSDPKWLIIRDTTGKVAVNNHYNKNEVDAKIAGAIKFVTKTATTNDAGRVGDMEMYNIGDKLINTYALSPVYATINISSYNNVPYMMYFVDARTGDILANTSVSYRYVYME